MLVYNVKITTPAIEDIKKIRAYITHTLKNSTAASKLSDKIFSCIESLAVSPKRHRVRKIHAKSQEIRYMPVDNFVITYCVEESNNVVKILNVLYGRRNLDEMI